MGRKRYQRKREKHRAKSGSPYRLVGLSGELAGAYINSTWRSDGMASIFMLKTLPGHGHALGAFLVDIWCMGLKDAWGRLDCSSQEFQQILADAREAMDMVAVDLDTARRLVAGGVRFANQNGFRLPPRYERWTAMLGQLGDVDTADLSDFGANGKLRCITTREDLKRRLVGCPLDEFLARPDVEFQVGNDDFTLLDDSRLAVEHVVDTVGQRIVDGVRRWCFANRIPPHPRLAEAWDIVSEAMMQFEDPGEDADVDPEVAAAAGAVAESDVEDLLALETPETAADLRAAIEQIHAFMRQFQSAADMSARLGIDDALGPEDQEDADK
jgi:hypothetical protein